jgi:hypothetical protein
MAKRRLGIYERRTDPLLPAPLFARRLALNTLSVLGFMAIALAIGISGYMLTERMSLVDAFVNAAMILSGMGPMGELHTSAGKIFAGFYALFSGIFFIFAIAMLLTPLAHRLIHRFHLAEDDEEKK